MDLSYQANRTAGDLDVSPETEKSLIPVTKVKRTGKIKAVDPHFISEVSVGKNINPKARFNLLLKMSKRSKRKSVRKVEEVEDDDEFFESSEELPKKKTAKQKLKIKPSPTRVNKPVKRLSDRKNKGMNPPSVSSTIVEPIQEARKSPPKKRIEKIKETEKVISKKEILDTIDLNKLSNVKSGKNTGTYSLQYLKELAKKLRLPTLRNKKEYIAAIARVFIAEGTPKDQVAHLL